MQLIRGCGEGVDSGQSRTRLCDVVTGGWHDAVIATLSMSFANQSIISDCLSVKSDYL